MVVHINQLDRGVYTATLDNPSRRNALNAAMFSTLSSFLENVSADPNARLVVIEGTADCFCAGRDLSEIQSSPITVEELVAPIIRLATAFQNCAIPTVAFVSGKAVGLGVSVACWSDIVVASERATFSLPEAKVGIAPSIAAISVIEVVGRRHAMNMCLTGRALSADEAVTIGLVHYRFEQTVARDGLQSVIEAVLAGGPEALRLTKGLVRRANGNDRVADFQAAIAVTDHSMRLPEMQEGLLAFKEKRTPLWVQTSPDTRSTLPLPQQAQRTA